MKRIRGILVDTINNTIKEHTVVLEQADEDYLPHFEEICKCDVLEVARRPIANHWVDIYCDEMGTYKPIQIPAVLMFKDKMVIERIVNNCFICNHTKDGKIKSLTKRERDEIMTCIMDLYYRKSFIKVLRIDV